MEKTIKLISGLIVLTIAISLFSGLIAIGAWVGYKIFGVLNGLF